MARYGVGRRANDDVCRGLRHSCARAGVSTCAGGVLYVGLGGQMGGGSDAPRGSPTSWVFPSLSSPKIPRSSGVGLVRVGKGGEVRGAKGEGSGG
jgi:hypothetical protein